MHQGMAYQDVVKFFLFDGVMDGLAAAAGLSAGLVKVFRKKKECKTNLRFFREISVIMMLRKIDALHEEGLLQDGMEEIKAQIVKKQPFSDDLPLLCLKSLRISIALQRGTQALVQNLAILFK